MLDPFEAAQLVVLTVEVRQQAAAGDGLDAAQLVVVAVQDLCVLWGVCCLFVSVCVCVDSDSVRSVLTTSTTPCPAYL